MSKQILSDKQIDEIYFRIADGEPLDNETARLLFADNCYYAGEYNQLLTEQRKERQDEQSIEMLLSDNYQKYSHGIPLGW